MPHQLFNPTMALLLHLLYLSVTVSHIPHSWNHQPFHSTPALKNHH